MRTKIAIVALVAAALTACNKGDAPQISEYITVNASVGELATRATAIAFEVGDAVSVYAWTGSAATVGTPLVVNNSVNTKTASAWTAAPQMLWKDLSTAHYFLGVYPQKAITNFTADPYTTPTDVLVATVLGAGRKAADGIVPMTFDHIMAKVVVNLTFRNQWATTPTVTNVKTSAKAASTVDYLTKTATATGSATDFLLTATTANTAYSAIIVPQDIDKIVITIDGKEYIYTHPSAIALAKGTIQSINLIVGREAIELGSVSINDWTTGTPITGGEALD